MPFQPIIVRHLSYYAMYHHVMLIKGKVQAGILTEHIIYGSNQCREDDIMENLFGGRNNRFSVKALTNFSQL